MTVETTHLLLRPWCEGDAVELQRLFSDPAVRDERSHGLIYRLQAGRIDEMSGVARPWPEGTR